MVEMMRHKAGHIVFFLLAYFINMVNMVHHKVILANLSSYFKSVHAVPIIFPVSQLMLVLNVQNSRQ